MTEPDSYSPVEASRVLGVSEKRVRQLADDGRLVRVQERPLRVSQESVHQLREERKANPPGPGGGVAQPRADVDVLARLEAITNTLADQSRRALEAADSAYRTTEGALREDLAAARARVTELEARERELGLEVRSLTERAVGAEIALRDVQEQLAQVRAELETAQQRRGWFRRTP